MYEQIDLFQFIILHQEFYLPIDFIECKNEFKELLRLPDSWKIEDQGIWTFVYNPENEFPEQGWKIHISATLENAHQILKIASRILFKNKVNFKFACDRFVLTLLNSKNWSRGGSGKFITIYPPAERFRPLLMELYEALKDFDGPYILSDMRYRDSKVLYYRYGGFQLMEILTIQGYKIPVIKDPDGRFVQDTRPPFYNPPPWVKDPFGVNPQYQDNILLNNRYRVVESISFSNSGGVYRAIDTLSNREVIIKEARPFISIEENLTAVDILKKEYEVLSLIEDLKIAPMPLNFFRDWEHYFLVEELIEGADLREFVVANTPVLKYRPTFDDFREYLKKFKRVFLNLCDAIEKLHSRGVIFRDLSHNNIIVQEDLGIKLIDFESAYKVGEDRWIQIFTPGFASKSQLDNKVPDFSDDIHSISENMTAFLFPVNPLFYLDPGARGRFVKELIRDMSFPNRVYSIIMKSQENGEIKSAVELAGEVKKLRFRRREKSRSHEPNVRDMVNSIYNYLVYVIEEEDFPPLYAEAYATNLLGVAYGTGGILITLRYSELEIPSKLKSWFVNQEVSQGDIPPGLFVGIAGIAWTLLEIGEVDKAEEIMRMSVQHPLIFENPDIFYGSSGVGLALLKFYKYMGENWFLQSAITISDKIEEYLEEEDGTLFFHGSDDDIHFGFAHGSSGVALFYLKLYEITKDKKYLEIATRLIQFDLKNAVLYKDVVSWHPSRGNTNTVLPYVKYGTAGILAVLFRLMKHTDIDFPDIEKALNDVRRKYALYPGQLTGLAGLGETLLDAGAHNKNDIYLEDLIKGLSLFQIKKKAGITFPSEGLFRVSCDFGTGCSGILNFLYRTITGKKRLFFDD